MHECYGCGQACDCDGEDIWNDAASRECVHGCEDGDDDDGRWLSSKDDGDLWDIREDEE